VQKSSKKWGVSERQVYYYVRRAQTLIREQAERVRQEAFDEHLMARRLLRKEAHDAGDGWLELATLKDEARLLGLYSAEQREDKQREDKDKVRHIVIRSLETNS